MKVLIQSLAVGCAGFVGALARWGVGLWFARMLPMRFPLGTFVINITGSLFLGWFLTFATTRQFIPPTLRLAIATGFVGAYTTFSTFMYDTAFLNEEGGTFEAVTNLVGSIVVGLLAVKLGMVLGRRP